MTASRSLNEAMSAHGKAFLFDSLRQRHPASRLPTDVILRACESFDFRDSRHESIQALRVAEIAENRIHSHSLRRPRAWRAAVSKDKQTRCALPSFETLGASRRAPQDDVVVCGPAPPTVLCRRTISHPMIAPGIAALRAAHPGYVSGARIPIANMAGSHAIRRARIASNGSPAAAAARAQSYTLVFVRAAATKANCHGSSSAMWTR
jgi:hypothetical protein